MKTMKIVSAFVLSLLLMPLFQSPLMGRDGMPKSAETTAKQLLSAYKSCNRAAALKVASPAVVNKIFKNCRPGEANWEYTGCDKQRKGYSCSYYYEGGAVNLRVVKYGNGYRAVSVGFVAD
jgi:hypothetical protein